MRRLNVQRNAAFLAILVPVRAILSDASIPLVLPTGGCLAFGSPEGSHSGKARR